MSAPSASSGKLRKSDLDVYRVHAPPDAFTRVYHEIIDNRDLTPNAKLLITHMLDQARKGEVYDIDRETIAYWLGSGSSKGYAGRHQVDSAINNAKACGFVLSEQANSPADGRFIIHWYVTEVRGHYNKAQMTLPFAGEDDPPPERASPLSDFPTADEPTADEPAAAQPTAEKPAADASHHGLMVNGFENHGFKKAQGAHGRGRKRPRRNVLGGPCLADLTECQAFITHAGRDGALVRLDVPKINMHKLFALFRLERSRGALQDVTTQQFVAAAVRAKNVVARDGGNLLALFAGIVNKRGANPQKPAAHWVVISEDDWRETDALLEEHKHSQEQWVAIRAVRSAALQSGRSEFVCACELWPGLTQEDWQRMDRMYPA